MSNPIFIILEESIPATDHSFLHYNHPATFNGTRRPNPNPYTSAYHYHASKVALIASDTESHQKILDVVGDLFISETGYNWANIHGTNKSLKAIVDSISQDEALWKKNEEHVIRLANIYKFAQNPDMLKALIATGTRRLVHVSSDPVYGIGLELSAASQVDPSKWPGQNKMGQILEELRHELAKGVPEWASTVSTIKEDSLRMDEGLPNTDTVVTEPVVIKDEPNPIVDILNQVVIQEPIETAEIEDPIVTMEVEKVEVEVTEAVEEPIVVAEEEKIEDPVVEEPETVTSLTDVLKMDTGLSPASVLEDLFNETLDTVAQ